MKSEQAKRLTTLSDEEFERLPFGAIRITPDGTIQGYNAFESNLARLDARRVIGKNFFRDVAPCTGVLEFEGRLQAFLKTNDTTSETFSYSFPFAHGTAEVAITFVRLPVPDSILIAVELVQP